MQKADVTSTSSSGVASNIRTCFRLLYSETFSYSTDRSVTVSNKPVAIVYRLVQLGILAYIIGFDLLLNKGYQEFDVATSTVTTKVKGLGFVKEALLKVNKSNVSKMDYERYLNLHTELTYTSLDKLRIFDTSDYIIPQNEYNSIFVMTNFIETKQTPGICEESLKRRNAICETDSDCQRYHYLLNTWNGIPTGRCINSTKKDGVKVCEINAWCPVEEDPENDDDNLIANVLNYTIFIKNDIEFKKFKKKERNILSNITNYYISTCTYEVGRDRHCPVLLIGYILESVEPDARERMEMLRKGGVIQIEIAWECEYDLLSEKCYPKYSFRRFDLPFKYTSTASGFNFRFSNKYIYNESEYRTLYKGYGLRFFISVTGRAGRFSFLPLMITIGAGFGLMSFSVIIADCVLLNFTQKKELFKKLKDLDANEAIETVDLYKTEELC